MLTGTQFKGTLIHITPVSPRVDPMRKESCAFRNMQVNGAKGSGKKETAQKLLGQPSKKRMNRQTQRDN